MENRISVLTIPEVDRRVVRTVLGPAGTDFQDRPVSVSVDVDLSDATPYVMLSIEGHGAVEGDDGILEYERSEDARALAVRLLEAAQLMDAMNGAEPA